MKTRGSQEIFKTKLRFLGASCLLLAAAVELSIVWNHSIKEELAIQAASFVRKGIVSTDLRGVVEFLNGVQFSSFDTVTLYRPTGERVITLPPMLDFKEQMESAWRAFFYGTISTTVFADQERASPLAVLTFSYARFELVHYAVIVWLIATGALMSLFAQAIRKVQAEIQNESRLKNAEDIEEIAKKIRHNIRSPLAVLKALFSSSGLEQLALLEQGRSAVLRLEEIVSEIRAHGQQTPKRSRKPAIFDISKVAHGIVAEKRLISGEVEIDLKDLTAAEVIYCEIPGAELKATLSNLIENSIQAISGKGRITVQVECDPHSVTIEVIDTGGGIPPEIQTRVFEKGFSYNKDVGSGLGLYYAKRLLEDHQGNIGIRSLGDSQGTTISLCFPRVPTPNWHVARLDFGDVNEVIVCDDQSGIIKTWQMRLQGLSTQPRCQFFSSCEAMTESLSDNDPMARLFLIDYDLGSGRRTGLDFARGLNQRAQVVLVTGHFDDPEIQDACSEIGCKLLPKEEIATIPIDRAI